MLSYRIVWKCRTCFRLFYMKSFWLPYGHTCMHACTRVHTHTHAPATSYIGSHISTLTRYQSLVIRSYGWIIAATKGTSGYKAPDKKAIKDLFISYRIVILSYTSFYKAVSMHWFPYVVCYTIILMVALTILPATGVTHIHCLMVQWDSVVEI